MHNQTNSMACEGSDFRCNVINIMFLGWCG